MSTIVQIFPILMKGVHITLGVLALSAVMGYLIAFLAGFGRLSKNMFIRKFTSVYIEIFRGTSLIVQIVWFSYALPGLFHINTGPDFLAGSIAIALNYGAYMSEVVRGSILSVAKGQTEASIALNMSRFQRMRLIILPQAIRMMLPEFGNYLIQMLKATSLVSMIGLGDILYQGNIFRSTHIALAPTVYLLLLVFYFIMALPLIGLTKWMERISSKGVATE